jgi:chromosome segregation ATPase
MSDQGYEELALLNKKLEELFERYNDLRTKNKELKIENELVRRSLQEKNEEIKQLEIKYQRVKLSGALLGEGGNAGEAKKKINELVREIDRCVALLNR